MGNLWRIALTLLIGHTACGGSTDSPSAPTPVTNRSVSSLTMNVSELALRVGETGNLSATATYSDGTSGQLSDVEWGSSNATVASVNSQGTITAHAVGTATITASSSGYSGSVSITINPTAPVDLLVVTAQQKTLRVGETTTVTLTAHYSDGSEEQVTPTWSSRNTAVATVTTAGTVTAVAEGQAVIWGTYDGKNPSVTITVIPALSLESLSVSVADTTLTVNQTTTATATATYSDGTTNTVTPTWSLSNTGVATVSSSGTVTAVAAGSATITGTYEGKTGNVAVTVTTADETTSDESSSDESSSDESSSDESSSDESSSDESSSDESSSDESSSDDSSSEKPVSSVSVSVATTSLEVGEETSASATATYSDGTTATVTPSWSSSNSEVATVSSSGTVTGVGVGTVVLTATYKGQSATVSMEITQDTWTVVGSVTGFFETGSVSNATVTIGNSVSGTTDANGRFELTLPQAGTYGVVIEASGYHRSETELDVSSQTTYAERNLIPSDTSMFDLNFYDHVFRWRGTQGTRRWVTRPTVEIWTTAFQCISSTSGMCTQYEATDETGLYHEHYARYVFENDVSAVTATKMAGLTIETKSHPPGTIVTKNVCAQPSDRIILVYVYTEDPNFGYNTNCSFGGGARRSSLIHIKGSVGTTLGGAGTYRHEIAHALGWQHPDGPGATPLDGVMRGPTSFKPADERHGSILYSRPAESQSPDKDPSGASMNSMTVNGVIPTLGGFPSLHTDGSLFGGPLVVDTAP